MLDPIDKTTASDDSKRDDTSRIRSIKSLLNWAADFYNNQRSFSILLLIFIIMYSIFKTFGLTPLKFINKAVRSATLGRKWTKVCTYTVYASAHLDVIISQSDLDEVTTDVLTTDCDFYILDMDINDTLRAKLNSLGLDFTKIKRTQ